MDNNLEILQNVSARFETLKKDMERADNTVKEIEKTNLINDIVIKDSIEKMFDAQDRILNKFEEDNLSLVDLTKSVCSDFIEFQRCALFLKFCLEKFKTGEIQCPDF